MVKSVLLSFNIITKITITIFILLSLSIVTVVVMISSNSGYESLFIVFAQMEKDKYTNQKMLHTQTVNSTSNSTFSLIGTISSLVITVPQHEFNITNAFKVILTGDWILNVHNGTVTNFETNFLASPMDGSMGHIHQITNFSANEDDKGVIIQPTSEDNNSNSLSINGTADIKINGITIWNDADLSITISKGNTITIDPDDKDTGNHFGNQQVYGIVNRLIVM
ncbi:MAG TPA: hypothetical protein VJ583_02670 [Nitrososphaeraceae archaeon]|nr:hypothetical protein [Nitrososphaeraceae archaeon]